MVMLKNTETGQIVEGVNKETFLQEISDPMFWEEIPEKILEEMKLIEGKIAEEAPKVVKTVESFF